MALLLLGASASLNAQTTVQRSLYVSANGDDNNNGRSEETPYRTLRKAVETANSGAIKTITVIGTIAGNNRIPAEGDEILITGKQDASEAERAVLSGETELTGRVEKVRFTNIRLRYNKGDSNSTVTLGAGAVVSNPNGKGVADLGNLIMTDDALITGCNGLAFDGYRLTMSGNAEISGNNSNENYGGGVRIKTGGSLTMSGNARIINNTTTSKTGKGGGVYLMSRVTATISGNAKISGNTAKQGGGIYLYYATLNQEGGEISGNKAEYGAGVYVEQSCTFNHKGGTVTGNTADFVGGGVYAEKGGTYTAGGGKATGNNAGDGGEDVFKQ